MATKHGAPKAKRLIWWEKSVEYAFVASMVKLKMFEWVVPMDGNHETALSDAVVNWAGDLRLIEFKKDIDSLSSEYEKYSPGTCWESQSAAYHDAKTRLNTLKGARGHGLIYGVAAGAQLNLVATPYWDTSRSTAVDQWLSTSGVSRKNFDEYLVELSGFRGLTSKEGRGSSGSRSFVAGVDKNGGRLLCIELEDFVSMRPDLKLKQVPELEPTPSAAPNWKNGW